MLALNYAFRYYCKGRAVWVGCQVLPGDTFFIKHENDEGQLEIAASEQKYQQT